MSNICKDCSLEHNKNERDCGDCLKPYYEFEDKKRERSSIKMKLFRKILMILFLWPFMLINLSFKHSIKLGVVVSLIICFIFFMGTVLSTNSQQPGKHQVYDKPEVKVEVIELIIPDYEIQSIDDYGIGNKNTKVNITLLEGDYSQEQMQKIAYEVKYKVQQKGYRAVEFSMFYWWENEYILGEDELGVIYGLASGSYEIK